MIPDRASVLVVGGTRGLGREIAQHFADRGMEVFLTGRDHKQADAVAQEIGPDVRGIGLELTEPAGIADALRPVERLDHLVLAAIERDQNTAAEYNIAAATYLVMLKLVGYTEVIHVLVPRMSREGSIVLFGGQAKDRPYPGSLTVSTVNGGITGMLHALAVELAPIRVNAIHPAIIADSPFWSARPPEVLDAVRKRALTGRAVTMRDVVDAVDFLVRNASVSGIDLVVDAGTLLKGP